MGTTERVVVSLALIYSLILILGIQGGHVSGNGANQLATLTVETSPNLSKKIPDYLFGIFFEEINHAGAGGLWAELVNNRGFEAGGQNTPSNIDPWSVIGNETFITAYTDRTSCFTRNIIALRLEVSCDERGPNFCPGGGVGVYNPGFWGMNIEEGKSYKLIFYIRSMDALHFSISLTSSDGLQILASADVTAEALEMANWRKVELNLDSRGTNRNSRLQFITTKKGIFWLDQVSLMPLDTYKGHGFRNDLVSMLIDLKPRFIRFPGGCFVEGDWLRNAFRWRESIGPWEERPGHFGDVWMYWTDDGLGYLEFLQLAEDIGAAPVWVINNGISHNDQVDTSNVLPFVQDALDSIEFARGDSKSKWGSVRAEMGRPEPFQLNYIAIGNEDCGKKNYRGNYLKFYYAIKAVYPDIQLISNCDGSYQKLDHPADLYDFHIYTSANDMFSRSRQFEKTPRSGPKAFVSEYAVTGKDAGTGSLYAALAEAAFLIGLEINSDVIEMASYAPLFVNVNDRRWNPDAIVFNSWQHYGTPSYWMQQFFRESSGATLHSTVIQGNLSTSLVASALTWKSSDDSNRYLKLKVVNFGSDTVNLTIAISGLQGAINSQGSTMTVLTSGSLMDENSFTAPNKVAPVLNKLPISGTNMNVVLYPHSFTSFDLPLEVPFAMESYRSAI